MGCHYINLRQKQQKMEKEKAGKYLTRSFRDHMQQLYSGGTSINRMFGNTIWIKFREKIFESNWFLFQIQFGKKKALRVLFSGNKT